MADPITVVRRIYEAFARGDIEGILRVISTAAEWEVWGDNSAQRAGVPWMQPRRGRQEVAEFFRLLAAFEVHELQVRSLLAGEDRVAAEVTIDATAPGGRRYRDEEVHVWTVDRRGQVVAMRHYADTAKHIRAAGLPAPA